MTTAKRENEVLRIVSAVLQDANWIAIDRSLPLMVLQGVYDRLIDSEALEQQYCKLTDDTIGSRERTTRCEFGQRLVAETVLRRFCGLAKRHGLNSDQKLGKSDFWIHYAHEFLCNQKWEGDDAAIWNSIVTASRQHRWSEYDGRDVAVAASRLNIELSKDDGRPPLIASYF